MNAVTITCPSCRATLSLKAGFPANTTRAKCPKCGGVIPLNDKLKETPLAAPLSDQETKAHSLHPLASDSTANTQLNKDKKQAGGQFSFLLPPQQPDEIGRIGPYRVLAEIGRGGMGTVFCAEDPGLRRKIALKVLLPQFVADPRAKARFLREARAQAAVDHEHVVTIHQVGEDRGVPYLAMPLLKGLTLSEALKANPLVPVAEAVRIAREISAGLAAAHETGLVHRDVKPGNVWLDGKSRRVKLLDFGLARPARGEEGETGGDEAVTQTGAVVGTPAYMSPEQARGEKVDARADLFSLGCVLYQMLAGRPPFRAPSITGVLIAVTTENPEPLSVVNPAVLPELDALVMRLLAKSVNERMGSAEEAVGALRLFEVGLDLTGVVAIPAGGSAPMGSGVVDSPSDIRSGSSSGHRPLSHVTDPPSDPWAGIEVTADNLQAEKGKGVPASAVKKPVAAPAQKKRRWQLVAALLGLFVVLGVAAQVIIKIKNKDGSETEIKVPPGATVEVTKDGKSLAKVEPKVPDQPKGIAASDWVPLLPSAPSTDWSKTWEAQGAQDWKLQDGELFNANTNRGWIGTKKEYTDFDIELEYKFGAKGNSGIFLRAWPQGEISGKQFVEVQLIDDGGYKTTPMNCTGAVFLRAKPDPQPVSKLNEWNTARVSVVGKRVTVTINGNKCVEAEVDFPREKGVIGLQQLDSPVYFRNVRARDLSVPKKETTTVIVPPVDPKDTPIDYAAERKAAEKLLKAGDGRLTVIGARGTVFSDTLERWREKKLPLTPFHIQNVRIASGATDEMVASLAGCTRLQTLEIGSGPDANSVGDAGFKALRAFPQLWKLELMDLKVGDEAIAFLRGCPNLVEIGLRQTQVNDAGLGILKHCPQLRTMESPPGMTDVGLRAVVAACPELRSIVIYQSGKATLDPLAALPRLRELHCSGHHLNEAGVAALARLPYFDRLSISYVGGGECFGRLGPLSGKLRSIQFRNQGFKPSDFTDPAKWLPVCDLVGLEEVSFATGVPVDAAALRRVAAMPHLRRFHIGLDGVVPSALPTHRKYTGPDVDEFRRRRPDVHLTIAVDGKEKDYPRFDLWPGKGEGGVGVAAWNLPKGAPLPANVPFAPEEAKKHQEAWAALLKQPVVTQNKLGMKFTLIPPGEFETTLPQEGYGNVAGGPGALVRCTKPFYLGTTEVTVGQFQAFVTATGYKTEVERGVVQSGRPNENWLKPGYETTPDFPVAYISLTDCLAFCEWLGKQDGAVYRPPTEIEWELGARGGGAGPWVYGKTKEELEPHAWIKETLVGQPEGPRPVAGKKANPFGLFDVVGNLWERCYGSGREKMTSAIDPGVSSSVWRGGGYEAPTPWVQIWQPSGGGVVHRGSGFRVLRQTTNEAVTFPMPGTFVARGERLSSFATVSRPAAIPGVRSWSVELAGHHGHLRAVAWSPKGDVIATGGLHDRSVRLWDKEGKLKAVLLGHEGAIRGLSFSPDGSLLASCDQVSTPNSLGNLRVWDVATGICKTVMPFKSWGTSVAFAPNGRRVALAINDPYITAFVVDLDTRSYILTKKLPGGSSESVCWAPDGKTFATGTEGGNIHICDSATGEQIEEVVVPDQVAGKPRSVDSLAFSPDGKWLAAGGNGMVRLWDAKTRKHIRSIPAKAPPVYGLAWHKDSRLVAITEGGQSFQVLDLLEGKTVSTNNVPGYYDGVAWSPDGTTLFSLHNRRPSFYDAATGKLLRQPPNRGRVWTDGRISPDARRVVFAPREFDAETGELLIVPKTPNGALVAMSPDGWRAYANGMELTVVPTKGDPVKLDVPGEIRNWIPAPSGTRIAGAFEKQVIGWDTATLKRLWTLEHPAAVPGRAPENVAWSPDGKHIATASKDKVVRLWDATDGKLIRTFDKFPAVPPGGPVTDWVPLVWKPDSRNLWVVNDTHIAQLDTTTGRYTAPENYSNGNTIWSQTLAADGDSLLVREDYGWTLLRDRDGNRRILGQELGREPRWHPDARRFLGNDPFKWGNENGYGVRGFDTRHDRRLGTLWPDIENEEKGKTHWMCVGPDGHWRGSAGVESQFVYVAMLEDGSQRTYTPAEFAKAFGWKNDPQKARLLKLDP